MNVFERVYICIKRRIVETVILFCTIFAISILLAGAVLINQAIINTDIALRSLLPAVAILDADEDSFFLEWHETGEWPNRENITTSTLHELGDLPYVRSFYFAVRNHSFYSRELVRAWHPELFLKTPYPDHEVIDDDSISTWHENNNCFERFGLNGVGNVDIFEIEFDIIELVEGRTFNAYEIEQGSSVAVVSQSFLTANNLELGDMLTIEHIIKDYTQTIQYQFQEDTFLAQQIHEFEIIGAFNRELPDDRELFGIDIQEHHQILNEIFVPATFVEFITSVELEVFNNNEVLQRFNESESVLDALDFENTYFLLYDPLYLQDFHVAVNEILPDFWEMTDYSFAYADVAQSMALIQEMADGLLIGAAITMLIVLSLLVLLFLRNRRKEIGIYLALGQSKPKILIQIILEIFIPTIIAITFALFIGNLLATEISINMLNDHIASVEHSILRPEDLKISGFRHNLTNEEMVEMFEVVIDAQSILTFYSIGLSTVFLSTIASVGFTLRMNPKDILTNSQE